jgi:tetratricopeptide (TPR) repeat protein
MQRLPSEALTGISLIELCLGVPYQRQELDVESLPLERDPLTGRLGGEILPGVFGGRYLGTYFSYRATIRLYAHVYDDALPNREILELYLRLRMLSTLLHEIAHHMQHKIERTRGRWCVVDGEARERDAEQREYRWAQQVAAPYLEQRYPEAVKALCDWMAYHGGVSISLATLAEAPKQPGVFVTTLAFESLVEAVHAQQPLKETRLGFAHSLYYAGHNAETLQIIERVLAEHPHDAEALTLQAHVYVHQKRYAEAEQIAQAVISRDENSVEAWQELVDASSAQGKWPELERATTRVIELGRPLGVYALGDRARARLELGKFPEATADIEALAQFQGRGSRAANMAVVLKAVLLLRTGCYEEAWEVATVSLRRRWSIWRCVLVAARLEAAHCLGKPRHAGRLTAHDKEWLREMGYTVWIDRLEGYHEQSRYAPSQKSEMAHMRQRWR